MECPFCKCGRTLLAENLHAFAIEDGFPVSRGHSLVIPKIHVPTIFDLPGEMYAACFELARAVKEKKKRGHSVFRKDTGTISRCVAGQRFLSSIACR